jgi:capsular exopolysaccharide synthesis family protein
MIEASNKVIVSDNLTLGDFVKTLKNRWALIAIIVLLVLLTTTIVTFFMPKWYRSATGIRVEKPEGAVSLFQTQSTVTFDPYFIQEQFEIIQSKLILTKVIENLKLQAVLSKKEGGFFTAEQTYLYLVHKMMDVESRAGTSLIDIAVLAKEDTELAAVIANEVARVYAENRIAFAISGQTEGIERLKVELVKQEKTVSAQRDVVENLREELEISGFDIYAQSSGSIDIENLRQMERTSIALKMDMIARKTRWEQFRLVAREDRFKLVNSEMIPDPNLQNLMQAYLIAGQTYVRLKGRLGEAHPDFIGATESLKKIEEQLNNLLDGYEKSLEISYIESQARSEELSKQLELARTDQITDAQSKVRPFDEALQKLREEEKLLKTLRLTLRQREIDFQVPKRTIETLNSAVPSSRPDRPNWLLNISLAAIMGLSLGIGCAFLVEFFDTSFRSIEDLERRLQLPILGVISRNLVLVGQGNYNSFESEPYRVIQTNLELATGGRTQSKILVVQSAGPGEGKSTTLYNLASVMAMAGQRVLIIDSDLRRPSQHQLFELPRKPGLIDFLTDRLTLDEIIQETPLKNLSLVTSGQGSHFSLSLLHGKQLSVLLNAVRGRFDKILLDSPPVIGISDSSVLASHADGVVFIVQHRRNPQTMTLRAKQILENVDGTILGVVLNQVPDSGDEDYNYYTSNYYYYSHKGDAGDSPDHDDPDASGDRLEFEESESTDGAKV